MQRLWKLVEKMVLRKYHTRHYSFATGRQPNVHVAKALNLEQNGKCLQVNEHYETSYAHVMRLVI